MTDTELLDLLEAAGDGSPWSARRQTVGKGFTVHNVGTSKNFPNTKPTLREAIAGVKDSEQNKNTK